MRISQVRQIARDWVLEHAGTRSDFRGALFAGSTTTAADDDELMADSDVDVMVVLEVAQAPRKLGKFVFRGVLLEVTYLALAELADEETVAASYHIANIFARDAIISDPTGRLRQLHDFVAQTFTQPAWIERRYENALAKIEAGLRGIDLSRPWHDQVTSWLFPTGITTHVILVAAGQNPTVRLRYLAARDVLDRCGMSELYPVLLELLGCQNVSAAQVRHHRAPLADAFDAAAAVARTPLPFSSDITPIARPIAIDGIQRLIDVGDHREAVFWLIATFARCQKILAADASPHVQAVHDRNFRAAVAELAGIAQVTSLHERATAVLEFLPMLQSAARMIAKQFDGLYCP